MGGNIALLGRCKDSRTSNSGGSLQARQRVSQQRKQRFRLVEDTVPSRVVQDGPPQLLADISAAWKAAESVLRLLVGNAHQPSEIVGAQLRARPFQREIDDEILN